MAVDVRYRLATAEEDFIRSFSEGTSALEEFRNSWSSIIQSMDAHSVDVDPTHATVSRVAGLASSFLEYDTEAAVIKDSLLSDLDHIFDRLSLADLTNPPQTRPLSEPSPSPQQPPPTYIAPAYKWLLKNIHNPYPSKETKKLMSRGSGTSLQNIDAWFLNARRRIGWTTISKKFFGGSKADTVAAAHRALKDDPKPYDNSESEEDHTPLPANIRMAFVEMEDAAKGLYSEKFTKSQLAAKLDGIVKDMTDVDRERRRVERKKEKAAEKKKEERERAERKVQEAQRRWKEAEEGYPSPSPEPESSKRRFETPGSVASGDEEDLTPPPPIAGHKRSSSLDSTDEIERPQKRSRILSSSSSCSSVDTLFSASRQNSVEPGPSSPSSSACSTPPPLTPSEDPHTSLPPQSTVIPKRKRRLSDANAEPRPKRPMPLVRPRLQVVSDPLPKSIPSASPLTSSASLVNESVLDWSQFFNQPTMAVTDELDTSGPLEFNMFDYSQFADYASSGETSDGTDWEAQCVPSKRKGLLDPLSLSSSPAIHVPSLTFTDFDLPAPVSVLPDFDLDFCATMGWPYVGATPSKPVSTGSPLEDSELNHLDGLSSLSSLPSYQPRLSPTLERPSRADEAAFDIDWSSIIPQTIPPTQPVIPTPLNPTVITPATINPATYLKSSAELRAEKVRKYQEHVAQALQLEAELAYV